MQILILIGGLLALEAVCGLTVAVAPVSTVLWLGLPVAVLLVLRPDIAYLAVIALAPVYGSVYGAPQVGTGLGYGAVYPFHLAVALMFAGCMLRQMVRPELRPARMPPLHVALLLFMIVALATTFWAPNFGFGLFGWVKLFFYWLVVVVAVWLTGTQMNQDPDYLDKIVQAWIVSGLVVAFSSIISDPLFYRMTHLPKISILQQMEETKRAVGLSWHANILASHLNVCILLAVSQLSLKLSPLKKWWIRTALLVMILSLLLALSRSAIVALAAGAVWYVYMKEGFSRRLGMLVAGGVLAGALFLGVTMLRGGGAVYYRYTSMFSPEVAEEQSMQVRFMHWAFGWERLVETYGLGLGPNGFGWLQSLADPHYNKNIHPHNIYLSILYDYGVLGFAFFAAFIIGLVQRLRHIIRDTADERTRTLCCALVAIMFNYGVHALLDFNLFDRKIWVFLAFALAAVTVLSDPQRAKAAPPVELEPEAREPWRAPRPVPSPASLCRGAWGRSDWAALQREER
jgi:O-antigen ligase